MTEQTQQEWPDIDAYAKKIGVGRSWVRNAVTARQIHHSRVGRHVRFSPEDQARNAAMWAQVPVETPVGVLIRIAPGARRAVTKSSRRAS